MVESPSFFVPLATRDGFNTAVKYIKNTIELSEVCVEDRYNLADFLNEKMSQGLADQRSSSSVLSVLLVDKWDYSSKSANFPAPSTDGKGIHEEIKKWKAVDVVIAYHHPDLGYVLINPKNPAYVDSLGDFRKNELVVVYAGVPGGKTDRKTADMAVARVLELISGKKGKTPEALLKGSLTFKALPSEEKEAKPARVSRPARKAAPKKPARAASRKAASSGSSDWVSAADKAAPVQKKKAAAAPAPVPAAPAKASPAGGVKKITPLYSVPVTNELFHNGNVEAWKRIINSYRAKYPHLEVFVYYDGERIIDINTLFKWGKVKHGSVIQFAVAGEGVKDVAKLQRYFNQGASPQFEAFLKGSPNTVMNLF